MNINVSTLKRGLVEQVEFSFTHAVVPFHTDVTAAEVSVNGSVSRTAEGAYWVEGHLSTVATAICDRCSQPYSLPYEVDFNECFRSGSEAADNGEECFDFQGDQLDIADLVQQLLCFATPSKLLCREECAGICPVCGADHNLTNCSCEKGEVDPRLAVLKNLLDPKQ